MPITVTTTAGGVTHGNPVVGPVNYTRHFKLTVTGFTSNEIDANGFIKPGTPIREASGAGVLVSGASQVISGVVVEAAKVAASNSSADIAAASATEVACMTIGQVNQDIIEDNLGRALTANELSAFAAAGCLIHLIPT